MAAICPFPNRILVVFWYSKLNMTAVLHFHCKVRPGAAALLLLALPALALDPSRRISQIHKQTWQVEQGLPHSYLTAVAALPSGSLLVGTAEGLARFDGVRFRQPDSDPSLRLTQRWISALLTARDGSVWIGCFDGALFQLRGPAILQRLQTGGSVFDLLEDSSGAIWSSTRAGVFRFAANQLTPVPALRHPPETAWNVLARSANGRVFVVTVDGLFESNGADSILRVAPQAKAGQFLSIAPAPEGALWIGTDRGLYRLADPAQPTLTGVPGVPGPVVDILTDRHSTLWLATWGKGLFRLTASASESWSAREGLPDDFIRTLAEDPEGDLWIGTRGGGLSRWRDSRFIPYGRTEGLAGDFATVVARHPNGGLYLGTWRGGLYRFSANSFEPLPTPVPVLFFALRALAFDPAGNLWAGNWEGLYQANGSTYQHYAAEPDSPFRHVSAILFDRRGALWVGTSDRGLFRFPSGRPTNPPPAPLLPSSEISSLLEDSKGRIWVGSSRGLRLISSGRNATTEDATTPDLPIESVSEDAQGRIWAAAADGALIVATPTSTRRFDARNGLPAHALYRVIDDRSGSFWISSPRGILQIRAAVVEDVLAGRRSRFDIVTHGLASGMRTIECHGLSQPAGALHPDGSVWFPTARGFVRIPPDDTAPLPPPQPVIEEISVSGSSLPFLDRAILRRGARNVQLRFSAHRLSSSSLVEFRYRLEGFDPDWVDSGRTRLATYNQLPPGEHRFLLQARDPLGAWSPTISLPLRQQPELYQTWWFALLMLAAAAAAVAGLYRWRVHNIRLRYAAVLDERNRIAREWHDTLVAGFSAISLQLEATLTALKPDPDRAAEIIDVTRKMVHHYRAEARRVIWDLRDSRPEGESLPHAIQDSLRRVSEGRPVQCSFHLSGEPVSLPAELEHNLLRICQEAASNALRHARPSTLEVLLDYQPSSVTASIRDNGAGFHIDEAEANSTGHFGLTVMRERARRFGGSLEIESRPGDGTIVVATIPVNGAKPA